MRAPPAGGLAGLLGAERFLARYPFFAALLTRIDAVADPSVPVMAVSLQGRRFRLHVNTRYFEGRSELVPGVLQHEIHHCLYAHATDPRFRGVAHPDLMRLAFEMSANEPIREPLPDQPVRWEDYRHLGMRAGMSTLEQYRILAAARERGEDVPSEPENRWMGDIHPKGLGALETPATSEHALASAHLARLVDLLGRTVPGAPKIAGRDPGRLEEALRPPSDPTPRIDWRAVLRGFAAELRFRERSRRYPNRRFPEWVGVVPGTRRRPDPGRRHVLVAIDTSGSMSGAELDRIAHELTRLRNEIRVTVVECDSKIQRVYPLGPSPGTVTGRGGTDLRPVFEPRFLEAHRPDGIVYCTDGHGPFPESPPRVPTLWILTKDESRFTCPWGRRVALGVGFPDEDVLPKGGSS